MSHYHIQISFTMMSVTIGVDGFSISKDDDEPYGSQCKVLDGRTILLKQIDIQQGAFFQFLMSIQSKGESITPVKHYQPKANSNIITKHKTF